MNEAPSCLALPSLQQIALIFTQLIICLLTVYCPKQNFTKSTENHIILLMALDATHLVMIKAFGDFCQRSFAVLFLSHLTSPSYSLKLEIPITPFLLQEKCFKNS